jgi:glycosyltransferase involved in cell wall biosynthesis
MRLGRILRERWDLVHCWEEPYVLAGGQVGALTSRKTPLVFFTDQNLPKNYPPPFGWIERYCVRRCSGWIGAGVSVIEALTNRGYASKPHRMIPHGVDLTRFYPNGAAREQIRRGLGWSINGPPVIGYLGRFVPEKGLEMLTRVLDEVPSPWRALFVGAVPMESAVRRWAATRPDRIRVVTQVRHDEVPNYLNAMDFLCAPSQTTARWREQFGRMLIEAFACGVAVAASDSGEMPNVVGEAGVIIPERDEAAWVQAVGNLIDNGSQRAALARSGLERARSIYSWPLIAKQHLEFFDEIVDRQQPT